MSDTARDLRCLVECRTSFGPVYRRPDGKVLVLCLEDEEGSFDPRAGFAEPFDTLAEAVAFVRGVARAYATRDKHLLVVARDGWGDGEEAAGKDAEGKNEKAPPPDTFAVTDDARPDAPPLHLRVVRSGHGVAVSAISDQGENLGEAALDFHDNRLQAIIYLPGVDEPHQIMVLVADVAAAARSSKTTSPNTRRNPVKRQTAASTDRLPSGNLLLPDNMLGNLLVSYTQAQALLQKSLPDAGAEDLEPFLGALYRDRTVLGVGDLLTSYFADCPIPYEPAP